MIFVPGFEKQIFATHPTISMPSEFDPIIACVGLFVVRTPNRTSVGRRRNHSPPAASPKPTGGHFWCYAARFQAVSYRNPMRYMGAATGMGVLAAASVGHGFVSLATVCDKDQA